MMRTSPVVLSNVNGSQDTSRSISVSMPSVQSQLSSKMNSWERLLATIGVPEVACTALIGCRSQKGRTIRSWIQKHYKTNFVPENVLQFLSLHSELNLKWHVEDEGVCTLP